MHQAQRDAVKGYQNAASDDIFEAEVGGISDTARQTALLRAQAHSQMALVEVGLAIEFQLVRLADATARLAAHA